MTILETLRSDYQHFPYQQTYSLYAEEVYFKDPMTEFRGRDRYQQMIGLMQTWFRNCKMEVHDLRQAEDQIRSDWTLRWNTPLPWQPAIAISGWSELTLNDEGIIISHIDYWHCSRWDVVKQHFAFS
jgi:Uncharacterized conserved protein (DUF2358)